MAQNEIQTLDLYGTPTGGTCDIIFDGESASGIAYNASAATVESALEALSNIGAGNVSCSGGPWPGSTITCEFVSSLAETALPEMTIDPSSLTGGSISASISETTQGGDDLGTSLNAYWQFDESSGNSFISDWTWNRLSDAVASYDFTRLTGGGAGSGTGVIFGSRTWSSGTASYGTTSALLAKVTADFSFSIWLKMDTLSSFDVFTGNVSSGIFSLNSWRLSYVHGTGFRFSVYNDSGVATNLDASTFGTISTGTWYHVVVSYDVSSKSMSVYVDGTISDTTTLSGTAQTATGSDQSRLGQSFAAGTAELDQAGHWSRVLTSSDVSRLYNSGAGRPYPLPGATNEVQTLSISGTPSTGSLTLTYGGQDGTVNYDDTAGEVESALESLSSIGSGNVTGGGGPLPGTPVTLTFTGDLAGTDIDLPSINYDLLLYKVATTQDGAPTPTQTTAAWSSNTLTPHITGGTSAWSSGDITATGNPEQTTAAWSTASLQAPGVFDAAASGSWTSGVVLASAPQQASASWSTGTPILPGVFSDSARAKWKTVQFAVIPTDTVMAFWSAGTVSADHNPVNVPTATWSSDNAIPRVAVDAYASAAWSTGELTVELTLDIPSSTWELAADALSPVMTTPSAAWTSTTASPVLIAYPSYIGFATFNLIDEDLEILNVGNEAVRSPDITGGTLTQPAITSESFTAPGITSETLDS